MRAKTLTRLEKLEKQYKQPNGVEMQCNDGSTIHVADPLEYIIENGNTLSDGRRLVSVVRPIGRIDAISAAFYEYADAVLDGRETLYTDRLDELLQSD